MKFLIVGIGVPNVKNLANRVRSGGESKLLSTLAEWKRMGIQISFLTTHGYANQLQSEGLDLNFIKLPKFLDALKINTHIVFLMRMICSVFKIPSRNYFDVVYSASDLYFDSLVSFCATFRNLSAKKICCLYLLARESDVEKQNCSKAFFLIQNCIVKILNCARFNFLVLNATDRDELERRSISKCSIFVTSGGVSESELNQIVLSNIEHDLCFVGRFHMQKGIHLLLESLNVIIKSYPSVKIAIVGGGDDQSINGAIDQFSEKYPNNVKVYKSVSRCEALGQLKNSKVFLFPSTNESWGIVVAEALYYGKPVVMYDLDYSKSIFNSGVVRVDKFDSLAFAQSALNLIESNNACCLHILRLIKKSK